MLLRLVEKIKIDPALCPQTTTNGAPLNFNPHLIFGMGQSLGSLILGPWGAVETDLQALIPSGNGAYWTIFMAQENPLDMKHLANSGRGLTTSLGLDIFKFTQKIGQPVVNFGILLLKLRFKLYFFLICPLKFLLTGIELFFQILISNS